MAEKPSTEVKMNVDVRDGNVLIVLAATGLPDVPILITAQAAFELGEKMARAAHQARFGEVVQDDRSYIAQQVRERVTEDYRMFLTQRVATILASIREDRAWSNGKVAAHIVEEILRKVT